MRTFWSIPVLLCCLAAIGTGAPPSPDFTGLRLGNHWTFADGTEAWIDRVDSTAQGWQFHRVSQVHCPSCPDQQVTADTSILLVRGDTVFQSGSETGGKWEVASVLPIKQGSRWLADPIDHDTLRVLDVRTARVPAGTYPGCLHARTTLGVELWLQKDIGLVRIADSSATASELKSFQTGK
jgi:hypothetical protein